MFKQCLACAGFVALVTVTLLASSGTSEGGPFARRGNRVRSDYYTYPDTTMVYGDGTYSQPYYPDEGRARFGRLRRARTPYYNTSMPYDNSMSYVYIDAAADTATYSTSGYRPGNATNAPTSAEMPARLRIAIPTEKADIWIEGEKSEQAKRVQEYLSPPLTPGKEYYYEVRARWTDPAGKQVERKKSFPIVPGRPVFLDFTRGSPPDKEVIQAPKEGNPNKK
jgi:uncharacterized protein (TIGR03000 family)